MFEFVSSYIERLQLLPLEGMVVVACSGGTDSLCLLHLLHRLCGPGRRYPDVRLHVAHLDHQLRGEAGARDAEQVRQLAESWGLAVSVGSVDVPALARLEHRSLEDAARVARYGFLRSVAQGQPIVVAHHQDDQVETLLLHWLRGGGIASMVGLQPRQGDIIRPLLAVRRVDTVAYCQRYALCPLEDISNLDVRFVRNRLRHEVLPLLEQINPGIRETILRNAEVLQADLAWIEEQVQFYWSQMVTNEQSQCIEFDLARLCQLPISLQRHLLRRASAQLNAGQSSLELRHYRLLEALMARSQSLAAVTLHFPDRLHVIRQGMSLILSTLREQSEAMASPAAFSDCPDGVMLPVPGYAVVPGTSWTACAELVEPAVVEQVQLAWLNDDWSRVWQLLPSSATTVYVDAACLRNNVTQGPQDGASWLLVRTRSPGDRIRPLGMAYEKKVQDVLVDRRIPQAKRASLPLFFSDQHCVWLAGVQIDDRVRLTYQTRAIVRLSIVPTQDVDKDFYNGNKEEKTDVDET